MADLKLSGKMPSDRERLMMMVMGMIRALRQLLRRWVGIASISQDALDEKRIA